MKQCKGEIKFVILAVYVDDIIPVSNNLEMLENEKKCSRKNFK